MGLALVVAAVGGRAVYSRLTFPDYRPDWNHVKSLIGVTAAVSVLAPGTIARSQGKAVRVRDLRPKQ